MLLQVADGSPQGKRNKGNKAKVKNFGSLRSGEFENKSKTSVFQSHIISVKPRTMVLSFFVVIVVVLVVIFFWLQNSLLIWWKMCMFLIINTTWVVLRTQQHCGSSQDDHSPCRKARTRAPDPSSLAPSAGCLPPRWQSTTKMCVGVKGCMDGYHRELDWLRDLCSLLVKEHMIQTHQGYHPNV